MDRSFILFRDEKLAGNGVHAQRVLGHGQAGCMVSYPMFAMTDGIEGIQLCAANGVGLGPRQAQPTDVTESFRMAIG